MVEAAGVEPASGKDQRGTSTCVATLADVAGRHPRWQRSGRPARSSFALRLRARLQAIPLCDAHPVPRGKKGPVDGLLKQPALTVSWRLVCVHLINEEWASARCPSLKQSRRNRFAPISSADSWLERSQNIA